MSIQGLMIVLFAVIQGRVYRIETVKEALLDDVTDASRSSEYFGRVHMLVASRNESVYVLAECWRTLTPNSCRACLDNTSLLITKCLSWSEGRVMYTGCFMKYSDTLLIEKRLMFSCTSTKEKRASYRIK